MNFLFKKVKCRAYLKKKCKMVEPSNADETVEDDYGIRLGFADIVEQDIYELIHKDFVGICVGTYLIYSKRRYEENYSDAFNKSTIMTNSFEPIRVAKIYYGNNKSRLVPLKYISEEENK